METTKEIQRLIDIFARYKDKVFIIDSITNKEFTYGNIEELSLRLATLISEKGINKGDRIAIILPNCIEFILIYFSCMQIGAIPVPINIKLHKTEIISILNESDPKLLFLNSMNNNLNDLSNKVETLSLCLTGNSSLKEFDLLATIKEKKQYSSVLFDNIVDSDTFIIGYTSGTTNKPKGVEFSYKNIISNGCSFIQMVELDSNSRFYEILSLSYTAGFYNLLIVPALLGGSVVLDSAFEISTALNFWKKVQKYQVNVLWLVPSIISMILSLNYSSNDLKYCNSRNIKAVFSCTAPLSENLQESFELKFSLPLRNTYGLSELLFVSANLPSQIRNKGVGKILPGCKVAIINADGGELSSERFGEIVVKSDYMNQSYYKHNLEITAINKDCFYTGDMGFLSADGFLYITDRKKDLIIRGGINISPAEIEEIIRKDKAVNEVAVIGLPHELQGEEIVAILNVGSGFSEKQLLERCRSSLASFKIPNRFLYVDHFPRSVTGKIQKTKLKESFKNSVYCPN